MAVTRLHGAYLVYWWISCLFFTRLSEKTAAPISEFWLQYLWSTCCQENFCSIKKHIIHVFLHFFLFYVICLLMICHITILIVGSKNIFLFMYWLQFSHNLIVRKPRYDMHFFIVIRANELVILRVTPFTDGNHLWLSG